MNILKENIRNNTMAVLPITIFVTILHFTFAPVETNDLLRFFIGSVLIIFGLSIFLVGAEIGVIPLGSQTGASLAKSNSLKLVIIFGIILGFFISVSEPSLVVLAEQVQSITSGKIHWLFLMIVVAGGLSIMVSLGFMRIFYKVPLYKFFLVLYPFIALLSLFSSKEYLAISFDASGATTGVISIPFIMALSSGISALKKDGKDSEKDSFGLVAIASSGAIISVLILGLFSSDNNFNTEITVSEDINQSLLSPFANIFKSSLVSSLIALVALSIILTILQSFLLKLNKRMFFRTIKGFIYTFLGMLLFLMGVNGGFMEVGMQIGKKLAEADNVIPLIIFSFILGVVTILAEPAVYILTNQVEDVTSGYVKKIEVLIPLTIGVGMAVVLSIVRMLIPGLQLWHYLLPGYAICLILMFIVPKLFVGIAFDSGGVATGPMTTTFIFAFTQGAVQGTPNADIMADGFGLIAMIALMPIITLQILGLIVKIKSAKKEKMNKKSIKEGENG